MNPFLLQLEDLPAWYALSFDGAQPAIAIRTHPAATSHIISELRVTDYDIGERGKAFGFSYVAPIDGRWGFPSADGPAGQAPTRGADGWLTWRFPLPCLRLGEQAADWRSGQGCSATLVTFFDALLNGTNQVEPASLGPMPQLMTVKCSISPNSLNAAPIFATLAPKTTRQLPQVLDEGIAASVIEAMRSACHHLWGDPPESVRNAHGYEAYLDESHRLHLRMPMGNAVGLGPEHWLLPVGEGDKLAPHNVDSPLHQLTLLAGLARLHEHLERAD